MASNLGVSFFTPFHELDPSKQRRCIFFTVRGVRCRSQCDESGSKRAIEIYEDFTALLVETISLERLQEYILCNCCKFARHQDRIEDIHLLLPLAQRWRDEIQTHAAEQNNQRASAPAVEEKLSIQYADISLALSTPDNTKGLNNSKVSPLDCQPNAQMSFSYNSTIPTSVPRSSSDQHTPSRSSGTTEFLEPRYGLRALKTNISTNSISARPSPRSISQPALSEFRPHVAEPSPNDSVLWKIHDVLEDRDFETGSLSMFDRTSSPGHVKIGWTARSVSGRLNDWSKCGYTPNLLFSVNFVPHAQRAETLTHHELIKEWRRERMCKAHRCRKSHQEWFEISKERAEQVLGDWADFMKKAEPYDSDGSLKDLWREVIKALDINGETVTAKRLLEHYEASLTEEAALVEELADLVIAPNVKQEVDFECRPKGWSREGPKETLVCVSSPQIEQLASSKEASLLEIKALTKQTRLVEFPLPKMKQQPLSDSPFERKPLPTTGLPLRSKPLPKRQNAFTPGSPFKTEPLVKTETPNELEPPFEIPSRSESKSLQKPLLAPKRTSVTKKLPPEQIQMRLLPLLQSRSFPEHTPSSPETEPSPVTANSWVAVSAAKRLVSITQREPNIEGGWDAGFKREPLNRDVLTHEDEIKVYHEDESILIENGTVPEADEWDADETLVEDQTPGSLEMATLKIVDRIFDKLSAGKTKAVPKVLKGLSPLDIKRRRLLRLLRRHDYGFSVHRVKSHAAHPTSHVQLTLVICTV
jgi:hypothetical protein